MMQNLKWILFAVSLVTVAARHRDVGADTALEKTEWRNDMDENSEQSTKESSERVDCRLRPESRDCQEAKNKEAFLSKLFNSWKDEVRAKLAVGRGDTRRGCRPRPGASWCTGKREFTDEAGTFDVNKMAQDYANEMKF